jgi:hypothetical protein
MDPIAMRSIQTLSNRMQSRKNWHQDRWFSDWASAARNSPKTAE